MVLESLVNIEEIREHPSRLFFLSVIGTIVAIIICYFLEQGGLFLIFLITLAILPITIKQLNYEEKREEYTHFWDYLYRLNFFNRHKDLVLGYFYLILGITLTISLLYILVPQQITNNVFSEQLTTISQITGQVTGGELFSKILFNNIGVIIVCFAFSLFYSSGAIFLISWNASVLGVVVGQGAKELFGVSSIPLVLFSYMPHGIPEFLGYVLAGIAGGILSIALTRHKEDREHFMFVLKDSLLLLVVSIIVILIGTIIEVSIIGF